MTEPFPFGAQDEAPVPFEDEAAKDRKPLIALGAVAAVALGAGAFLFLGGGDEAEEDFAVPTRAARPAAAAAAPAAKPAAKVPAASTIQLGRNPFKALYVAAGTGAGGGTTAPVDAGTPPTTSTPATGGTPIVVVGGGGTTTPTTGGSTEPKTPTSGGTTAPAPAPARSTVKLTQVSTKGEKPVATFVLDGKELTGSEGDVLGGKLLVISLQQDATGGWFANLQVGDGSPFEVHERQEVVVSQ